jgi:murein DD-endopeptidase MepM/ murein hydrolase activator NlpD
MKKDLQTGFSALIMILLFASGIISCKTTSSDTVYLIKLEEGDTLSKIATKYDTTWQDIAELNNIKPGSEIKVGTVLRLMPGPGGIIAKNDKKRIFGKSLQHEDDEESHPDLERETDDVGGGLFFNNKSGLNWPVYGKISSNYGKRGRSFHHGIDIRAKRGTKVYAAGEGVVEFAGRQNGYGKIVIVRHQKMKTAYAHLDDIEVSVGEKVAGNTIIGEVGMTGKSSGPHLHFEVRTLADKSVNPLNVFNTKQLLSGK